MFNPIVVVTIPNKLGWSGDNFHLNIQDCLWLTQICVEGDRIRTTFPVENKSKQSIIQLQIKRSLVEHGKDRRCESVIILHVSAT